MINGESQWRITVHSNPWNDANIGQYNYIPCRYKVDARKIQNSNTTKKQIQNHNAVHTGLKSRQYKILKMLRDKKQI